MNTQLDSYKNTNTIAYDAGAKAYRDGVAYLVAREEAVAVWGPKHSSGFKLFVLGFTDAAAGR